MISAKVIADSITTNGDRLTTMELHYPRFIHGELMTHRVFSRNAASSRAIPITKMLSQVRTDPAMPVYWGINQPGMQATVEVTDEVVRHRIQEDWRALATLMAGEVEGLFKKYNLHKQILNRLLEPWQEMQTVVSSTTWENFFSLRLHKDAQPEMQALAKAMFQAMNDSDPRLCGKHDWHLPYVSMQEAEELGEDQPIKTSVARCARVSYLNHGTGKVSTPGEDSAFFYRLAEARHMSPFEHVARPLPGRHGNFSGWQQYRQILEGVGYGQ